VMVGSPLLPFWTVTLQPLGLHSLSWSVFDVELGSGVVYFTSLVDNQPQFGEPTDPESRPSSLVGSVTLAQQGLDNLSTGSCCL